MLKPLIDWCKSGLSFINEGIPGADPPRRRNSSSSARRPNPSSSTSSKRAGVDFDQLLSKLPEKQQQSVLDEARSLARWTRYKKAYSDICLRVDLLGVDDAAHGLDKEALFEDLVNQDRDLAGSLVESDESVEGSLEWAWFAGRDVIEVASGERRKVEQQKRDKAEEKRTKIASGSKKLSKTSSRLTGELFQGEEEKPRVFRKQLADPSVEASRGVLDRYLSAIKGSLEAAREARLK